MEHFLRVVLNWRARKTRGEQQVGRSAVPEQYTVALRKQLDREEFSVSAYSRRMASELKAKQPRRRRSAAKYVRSLSSKPMPTISESEEQRSLRSYYVHHQANGDQIISVPANRGSFFSGEGSSFPVCLAIYDVRGAGKSETMDGPPANDGSGQIGCIDDDDLAMAGDALYDALAESEDEGRGRTRASEVTRSRRAARLENAGQADKGSMPKTPAKHAEPNARRSSPPEAAELSPKLAVAAPDQAEHPLTRSSSSETFVTAASDTLTEMSADSSPSSPQLSPTKPPASHRSPGHGAEQAAAALSKADERRPSDTAKPKKFTVDSARDLDFELTNAKRKMADGKSVATKPEPDSMEPEEPSTPVAQNSAMPFVTHDNPAFSPESQDGSAVWEYPAQRLPKSIRTAFGKSAVAEAVFGDSAREGSSVGTSLAFAFHTLADSSGAPATPRSRADTPPGSRSQLDSAYKSPFSRVFSPCKQLTPANTPRSSIQQAQAKMDRLSGRRASPKTQRGSDSPDSFQFRLEPEAPFSTPRQQQAVKMHLGPEPSMDMLDCDCTGNGALLVSQEFSLCDLPQEEDDTAKEHQGSPGASDATVPLAATCDADDEGEGSSAPAPGPRAASAEQVVLASSTIDQLAQEIRRRQDTLEQLILFYDSWVDKLGCADLMLNAKPPGQASRLTPGGPMSGQPSFTSSQFGHLDSKPRPGRSGGKASRVEPSDLSSSSAFSELSGHSTTPSEAWGLEDATSLTVVLQDGGLYRGNVGSTSKPQGLGRYQSSRATGGKAADLYQGEFSNGLMHGYGVYYFGGCGWYSGEWVRGRQQGFGKQIFANGTMCLGSFGKKGRLDGYGVCLYPTGDSYEGQFKDGVPHGHGYHKAANKGAYAGSFAFGRRCGIGVYRFANGDTFAGTFEADHPSGHGIYTTRYHERLEGEFSQGQVHGWGVRVLPDSAMAAGKWEQGRLQWSRVLLQGLSYDDLPDLDAEGMDLAQETARSARHSAALAERAARAARKSARVTDAVRLAMQAAKLADAASKKGAYIASK